MGEIQFTMRNMKKFKKKITTLRWIVPVVVSVRAGRRS